MWNRAFFRTFRVRYGAIADIAYEEPFTSLLSSHEGSMVDPRGCYSNSRQSLEAQLQSLLNDMGLLA